VFASDGQMFDLYEKLCMSFSVEKKGDLAFLPMVPALSYLLEQTLFKV
jgi:hypothetical protein